MRYCIDLCQHKETAICCADCDKKDCDQRCEGVKCGKESLNCRMLNGKSQEDGDE